MSLQDQLVVAFVVPLLQHQFWVSSQRSIQFGIRDLNLGLREEKLGFRC